METALSSSSKKHKKKRKRKQKQTVKDKKSFSKSEKEEVFCFGNSKTRSNEKKIQLKNDERNCSNNVLTFGEENYLNLCKKLISEYDSKNVCKRGDRTGVGTLSSFGEMLCFELKNGQNFPLFTTKKMFFRGVAEELFWIIEGSTDSQKLSRKGIKIWDENGSRSNLDKLGFNTRREGDLGPVYGFQWRHFGAEYKDCDTDYTGQGFDQLKNIITLLKKDPESRRIVMSAWNPKDNDKMALPACHTSVQFYVKEKKYLSCFMFQRSGDLGLGVPFNVASYALLTCLLAHVCNLQADLLKIIVVDAHIYLNHIESLREQSERTAHPFPSLVIDSSLKNIEKATFQHLRLKNYNPNTNSLKKMKMAV